MGHRVVIISPARNEGEFIETTLRSMINQTRRPDRWTIVDDSSDDGTENIVAKYAAKYSWIEIISRARTGGRQLGPNVVKAFNH